MRITLLWIFGLVPATIWLAWAALYALLSALAVFSSPGRSVLLTLLALLSAYGALSIVLAVLGRPRDDIKRGLFVALAFLIPSVVLGAFSEPSATDSIAVLVGFGLTAVTILLLKEHNEKAQKSSAGSEPDNS